MSEPVRCTVKVSRPLGPDFLPWTAHDATHTRRQLLDPPPERVVAAMPGKVRHAYFDAVWHPGAGRFVIGEQVRDEAW